VAEIDERSRVAAAEASLDDAEPAGGEPAPEDSASEHDSANEASALGEPVVNGSSPTDDEVRESVSDLVEQVGHDAGVLVLRQVQLTASQHIPALRRTARDVAVAAVALLAVVTAFALANWAAVLALDSVLPGWQAPLVLAGAWAVLGLLLVLFVLHRTGHVLDLRWWRAVAADPARTVADREEARDTAHAELRDTLDRFGGAVAGEAEAKIRAALMPVADGVLDAGHDLLDTADEIGDAIEEAVPGGGVVNYGIDVVLVPGRFGLRLAKRVLGRTRS
jgi:hypothetical protein